VKPAWRRAGWAALLVLAAAVPYLRGLPGGFVYDDRRLIVDNEGLQRPFDARRAFLRDYYASDVDGMGLGYYRPVAILLNELDYRRGGGGALPFHVANIAVHAGATLLVAALALRLFRREALAVSAGLLFAVHPSHAESVAFISGRVDPLATLFALLAALLHLRGAKSRRPGAWRAGAACAWLTALLSKEMAITVPALIALLEIAEEGLPGRATLVERLRRYVPYAFVLCAYVTLRVLALGGVSLGSGPAGPALALTRVPVVLGSYLAWLFVPPPGLHLEPAVAQGPLALAAVAWLAFCVVALVWLARRGLRGAAAALGWCLVSLLPVAQLRPLETQLSERFLYLPSVGAVLLLALLFDRAASAFASRWLRFAPAVLAGAYLAVLEPRVFVWRDAVRLWAAAAREKPDSVQWQVNLALALGAAGDLDGAKRASERVAVLAPELAPALAADLEGMGAAGPGTLETLRRAVAANPQDAGARASLGFHLLEQGSPREAADAFRESVALVPTRSNAWLGLALAELRNARFADAGQAAREALALNPQLPLARMALAESTLRLGDPCAAVRQLEPLRFDTAEESKAREELLRVARGACPAP